MSASLTQEDMEYLRKLASAIRSMLRMRLLRREYRNILEILFTRAMFILNSIFPKEHAYHSLRRDIEVLHFRKYRELLPVERKRLMSFLRSI